MGSIIKNLNKLIDEYLIKGFLKFIKYSFFILIVFFYITYYYPYRNTDFTLLNKAYYSYKFSLTFLEVGIYEVYLPIIVEENGNISQIMDKINFTGNVTSQIVDTVYGKALKLVADSSIEVNINVIKIKEGVPVLSLANYSGHPPEYFYGSTISVWLYSNRSNIEIDINFSYHYYTPGGPLFNPIGYSPLYVYSLVKTNLSVCWMETLFTVDILYQ